MTTELGEYILCGCLMSTIWTFDRIEKKHSLYRGKDCMRKFCKPLRKNTKNMIGFEKNHYRIKNVTEEDHIKI